MKGDLSRFCGIQITPHPYAPSELPKLKLRPDVPVTDKFRAEMDAWLLEMFGTEKVVFMWQGGILASPENVVMLKGFA